MQLDYDEIVNGNGEWRNIQAVVRTAFFTIGKDTFQVKAEMTNFVQRLAEVESLLAKFGTQQKEIAGAFDKAWAGLSKLQADQEESALQIQHQIKTVRDEAGERLSKQESATQCLIAGLEQRLMKEISLNAQECAELKRRDAERDAELRALRLEVQELRQNAKEAKAAVDETASQLRTTDKNVQSLHTKIPTLLAQLEQKISALLAQNYMSGVQVEEYVSDKTKALCSKSSVSQIAQRLNEDIQAAGLAATRASEAQLGLENRFAGSQKEVQQLQSTLQQLQAQQEHVRRGVDQHDGRLSGLQSSVSQLNAAVTGMAPRVDLQSMQDSMAQQLKQQEDAVLEMLDAVEKRLSKKIERESGPLIATEARRAARAEVELAEKKLRGALDSGIQTTKEETLRAIRTALGTEDGLEKIRQEYLELRSSLETVRQQLAGDFRSVIQEADAARMEELGRLENTLQTLQEAGDEREQRTLQRMREMDELLASEALGWGGKIHASWTWRTKKLSKTQAIIWTQEEANACPAGLIWEKGKSSILVVQAGCYRVEFAVFGKSRPTVQVIVNNEPLVTALGNSMSSAVYTQPKSAATGCFYGQTHTDYLYLAQHSVVQLGLASEFANCVSGYMSIQKVW